MIFSTRSLNSIVFVTSAIIVLFAISIVMYSQFENNKAAKRADELSQRWLTAIPLNMSYEISFGCMTSFSYAVYRVDGKNYYEKNQWIETQEQIGISEIFNAIQRATTKAYSLDVQYNSQYGFPERVKIDWNKDIYDDECFYTINKFKLG
jgi:hypothetical protein